MVQKYLLAKFPIGKQRQYWQVHEAWWTCYICQGMHPPWLILPGLQPPCTLPHHRSKSVYHVYCKDVNGRKVSMTLGASKCLYGSLARLQTKPNYCHQKSREQMRSWFPQRPMFSYTSKTLSMCKHKMDQQETQSQQQFISALLHSLMRAHDTTIHMYEHKTLIYRQLMDQIAADLLSWAIRSSSWHYHNVDSQYQQFVFQHSSPQRNCEPQHSFPQQFVFAKTHNLRSYVHPGSPLIACLSLVMQPQILNYHDMHSNPSKFSLGKNFPVPVLHHTIFEKEHIDPV